MKNGDLEDYFAELRAYLILGTKNERKLEKLDAFYPEGKVNIPYEDLRSSLLSGISDDDPHREEILFFVSDVTKNYKILNAVLQKAQFTAPKEFQIIYRNLAKQSSHSGEKRKKLAGIRDYAFKILVEQTDAALAKLHSEEPSEDQRTRIAALSRLYQDNLLFVTNYRISEYILDKLLSTLDFRGKNSFRLFYKNMVFIENCKNREDEEIRKEREKQRQKIIDWIKASGNKEFMREALSHAFRYENSDSILKDIVVFLDKQKEEGGIGEITLQIPLSSFNYEKYTEYENRKKKTVEEKGHPVRNAEEIDKKGCEMLVKRIAQEGAREVVYKAFCDRKLIQLAGKVIDALTLDYLSGDDLENIKKEIAKFDWHLSKSIRLQSHAPSADLIYAESDSKGQIEEFDNLARRIVDSRTKKNP